MNGAATERVQSKRPLSANDRQKAKTDKDFATWLAGQGYKPGIDF